MLNMLNIGGVYIYAYHMRYANMLNMLNIEGGRYICIPREICKYAKYTKYRGGSIYMHTT